MQYAACTIFLCISVAHMSSIRSSIKKVGSATPEIQSSGYQLSDERDECDHHDVLD